MKYRNTLCHSPLVKISKKFSDCHLPSKTEENYKEFYGNRNNKLHK